MVQQTFAANQDQILQDGSKRVGALRALGFIILMAIIGVSCALAWRAYGGNYGGSPGAKAAEQESLARDTQKLKNAVEQLESSRLELLQRIETLQANQQRAEQLRQADIERFSQQISTLDGELRKLTLASPAPPRVPGNPAAKRNPQGAAPATGQPKQSAGTGKPPTQGNSTPNAQP